MTAWVDEYARMLDDCEGASARLTESERAFLGFVRRRVGKREALTKTQCERLDDIWERATAQG